MRQRNTQRTYGLTVLIGSILGIVVGVFLLNAAFTSLAREFQPTVEPQAVTVNKHQPAIENVPGALALVNQFRATEDLPAVSLDTRLETSAQAKADDLVALNYWAHERPGKTPWDFFDAAGYEYDHAGENLAKCWTDTNAVVEAWIASPGHRAVLLGDFEDVGFGIAHNSRDNCNYVVAHFGSQKIVETQLPATGVSL